MNKIVELKEARQCPDTLEKLLGELSRHGEARVGMYNGGWVASVEMFVKNEGAQFNVRSEFNHKTPLSAARQCYMRLQDTLDTMK